MAKSQYLYGLEASTGETKSGSYVALRRGLRLSVLLFGLSWATPGLALEPSADERLLELVAANDLQGLRGYLQQTSVAADIGSSALLLAVEQDNEDIAGLLLAQGIQADGAVLAAASAQNMLALVKVLLNDTAFLNGVDADGMTALMQAALYGHEEMVAVLLAAGAKVNLQEPVAGYSALILASAHGYGGIVRRLLKAGADLHALTDEGHSALDWARSREGTPAFDEVVAYLLEAGAD